jgi:tetratricopeptide (TPR) repeat protein
MNRTLLLLLLAVAALVLAACSSSVEAPKPLAIPAVTTKEMVYAQGHRLYADQQFDSAAVLLRKSVAMDPAYQAPLTDLAEMYYLLGLRQEQGKARWQYLKESQRCFQQLEALGRNDAEIYERLCEVSNLVEDRQAFLKYARKSADAFPYDRQYFNLALAYFNVGDYQSVIRTQRTATQKFASSPFIGGFYKYLGRAYMKVDRDQTAERTFGAGVQAVDAKMRELADMGGEYETSDDYSRLLSDKIDMLLLLKKLHEIYGAKEKLQTVERQLRDAGYNK